MQTKPWKLGVIAAVFVAFLASYLGFGLTLGIDLAGGTVLIYQLKRPEGSQRLVTEDDAKATAEILQRRLDGLGMKEMTIRPAGIDQILIQLPGVEQSEAKRIQRAIAKSGQLFFKIPAGGFVRPVENLGAEEREHARRIAQEKSLGVYDPNQDAYDTATYQETDRKTGEKRPPYVVLLQNDDLVDGRHLTDARESRQFTTRPTVDFELDKEGADLLARTTTKHRKEQMCIVLDGVIISAPVINTPIPEGRGLIEGDFTPDEKKELITVLKSGALPAKPELQSEDSVAPTLGDESIQRGMTAIYLAMAGILIFMVVYYRAAGVIANVALILNLVVLLGTLALFQATLTLPGIAGILLTMGMAVDANILINERIREEWQRGVPIGEAIRAGYHNAFSAILDSNLTTILTAAILYYVGTGPIRGFAVTLTVGIITSMFTALWVTRALFEVAVERGLYTKAEYMEILKEPKFELLKNRRPFVIGAIVLVNASFLAFVLRGDEKYGIDFNGGSTVQVRTTEARTASSVEDALARFEVEEGGSKVRPLADVEVQRLGQVDDQSRATLFQVFLSAHGKDAPKPKSAADVAEAGDAAEAATQPGGADLLERAIRHELGPILVPEAYSAPRWTEVTVDEPDPASPGQVRKVTKRKLTIEVRFDPRVEPQVDAAALGAALEAGEALLHGGRVAAVDAGPPGVRAFSIETAALDYGVADELVITQLRSAISKAFGKQLSSPFPFKTTIGGAVAESLKAQGTLAIVLSILMMIVYIAFRFELRKGLAAALCLVHDVAAALGVMMLFDALGIEAKINLTTIAAFLTIVGFSINDTIVTFDRMRENAHAKGIGPGEAGYEDLLNRSINQTLGRTILTSFTVFLVLVVLALAGVSSLQGFTIAMLVGVVFGTLSTIYVATPLVLAPQAALQRFLLVQGGVMVGMIVLGRVMH